MLPPNAHWKGLLRFGLIRLRSISSHGTAHASPYIIAQKAPLRSKIPIPTGSMRQTRARRQYIARSRAPFPGLAISWKPRHSLGWIVKRPGGSICYRDTVLRPSLRRRISHRRVGKHDVWPAVNIKSLPIRHPQSEASQGYCPQLPITKTLNSPAAKDAVPNGFDAEVIVEESSSQSFGSRNEQAYAYRARELNTDGARPVTVPIPTRASIRHVQRKRFTRKLLTRKGRGSRGIVNSPGPTRTLRHFWPHPGGFRAVRLAATSKEQRGSIHVMSRPLGKKIEVLKEPLGAGSTEKHTGLTGIGQSRSGNVSAEVPTRPVSCTTATELPAKYTDLKDPTFSETNSEIHRQNILTREILTWFKNPEVQNGNNAISLQPCLDKSSTAQVSVTDRPPTAVLQYTEQEATLTEPSSGVVGTPFLLPSLREPSIYTSGIDNLSDGLSVAHIFEHPSLPEFGLKIGDPIKRHVIPNHQSTNPSASSSITSPSLTFQKKMPDLAPPPALPVIGGPEVTYQDILDGLQLGLSAILDSSDVDFWVKEVVGTSARRFLADIAALGGLRGK